MDTTSIPPSSKWTAALAASSAALNPLPSAPEVDGWMGGGGNGCVVDVADLPMGSSCMLSVMVVLKSEGKGKDPVESTAVTHPRSKVNASSSFPSQTSIPFTSSFLFLLSLSLIMDSDDNNNDDRLKSIANLR
jgi:hypothetical protein